MKKQILFTALMLCVFQILAQVNYTAKDQVTPYEGHFRPGTNMGYNPPWSDEQLANIAAGDPANGVQGIGAKAIRPLLSGEFLEQQGYDARVNTYQHYKNLGMEDLTNIVGFPVWYQRDPNFYCSDHQSEMFANLYEPIWDNGENGTPVNDNNYYALYLYKTVTLYKDYVKFWEIWNEPGFDYTFATGWLPPGAPGNWWENNPDPCDYKLRAPIFHFVRTLRISWEIIKAIDPDAYVALAGVGYPAFLDAVMRNTDNPNDGSPTADYPHGGGAYFDVMGFHSYPHFDGSTRYWDNNIFDFVYTRHSDAAADGIPLRQATYQDVLSKYGFDGATYPQKEWIITEINVPRRSFSEFMGGELVQRNFILKGYISCLQNNISQIHVYSLGEEQKLEDATFEFHVMGLYEHLGDKLPYEQVVNDEGIAFKTASDLLFGFRYDAAKTAEMNIGSDSRGAALVNDNGEYKYVLWARTFEDQSENVASTYTFPASFNLNNVYKKSWNYSQTDSTELISGTDLNLTSTPIFLSATPETSTPPRAAFTADRMISCLNLTAAFTNLSSGGNLNYEWTFEGGTPATSTDENPVVTYDEVGKYLVRLKVTNALGEHISEQSDFITISDFVQTAFEVEVDDNEATFTNNTVGAIGYQWGFGDGTIAFDQNPVHEYQMSGTYEVVLTAYNGCGAASDTQTVVIDNVVVVAPTADFVANETVGCAPFSVAFADSSSSNTSTWEWTFQGGIPATSTVQNPSVIYLQPGVYSVTLKASNSVGDDTVSKTSLITVGQRPNATYNFDVDSTIVIFDNNTQDADSYFWDFGNGDTSRAENPIYDFSDEGEYIVKLYATNECGTSADSQRVVLLSAPTAGFILSENQGCAPLTITFTNKSTSNVTNYLWSFPGGTPSTSTDINPVIRYDAAGTYSATLLVSNAQGNGTMTQTDVIVIDEKPTAQFSITGISGRTVNLGNQVVDADSYSWDFGDGKTSDEIQPAHTYEEDGNYTIQLIATNQCGSDTSTQMLVISTPPSANFSVDINKGCAPMTVQFSSQASDNTTGWEWRFPGGSPSASFDSNPVVTYNNKGIYDVSLKVINGSGADSVSRLDFVVVETEPEAAFVTDLENGTATFGDRSFGAVTYEWWVDGIEFSTAAEPEYTFTENGAYMITQIVSNDCGTDTTEQTLEVTLTNLNELEGVASLSLFPNPNDGQFILSLDGVLRGRVEANIYNLLGQSIHQQLLTIDQAQSQFDFQLDRIAPGTYFLELRSVDGQAVLKFVVD